MEVASRMPNCGNSSRNEAFCVDFGRSFDVACCRKSRASFWLGDFSVVGTCHVFLMVFNVWSKNLDQKSRFVINLSICERNGTWADFLPQNSLQRLP